MHVIYQVNYTNCNQKGHNHSSDRNIFITYFFNFGCFGFSSTEGQNTFLPLWTLKMKQVRELCQVVTFFTCDKSFLGKNRWDKISGLPDSIFPCHKLKVLAGESHLLFCYFGLNSFLQIFPVIQDQIEFYRITLLGF